MKQILTVKAGTIDDEKRAELTKGGFIVIDVESHYDVHAMEMPNPAALGMAVNKLMACAGIAIQSSTISEQAFGAAVAKMMEAQKK